MSNSSLINQLARAAVAGMIALAVAASSPAARADYTLLAPAAPGPASQLIGVWVLVGTPDNVGQAPSAGGRIKLFTGTHWCIVQAEPKSGVVLYHHGGTYTVNGNQLHEDLNFANASTMNMMGKTNGRSFVQFADAKFVG